MQPAERDRESAPAPTPPTAQTKERQARPRNVAEHVRASLYGLLRRRSSRPGTWARSAEDGTKSAGAKLWMGLKHHPYWGVLAAGIGGTALGTALGVGEVALGVAVAYAAFNVLARGESPEKAAELLAQEIERA
jgi:hypothetical protein